MKNWSTPIYAFFRPIPTIEHVNNRRAHVFECNAKQCKGKGRNDGRNIRRYLGTADAMSTSNLKRHTKGCWGEEMVEAASSVKDVHAACLVLAKPNLKDGSITAAFERVGKEKVTYSHRQHTKTESRCVMLQLIRQLLIYRLDRAEFVWWVSESMRSFQTVKDRGFQSIMKTGRPGYYIPSPETISCDVKKVFVRCRERIAKMLQVCVKI